MLQAGILGGCACAVRGWVERSGYAFTGSDNIQVVDTAAGSALGEAAGYEVWLCI